MVYPFNLRLFLAFFVLVPLAGYTSADYELRLKETLGTEDVTQIRASTAGSSLTDTFFQYRFVTSQSVIDTFVERHGLTPGDSFGWTELLKTCLFIGLLCRDLTWWQPEEIAGQQTYFGRFPHERDPQLLSNWYELAYNPETGVAYFIEAYP